MREHKRPKPGAKECICGSELIYNERWDAYYCEDSNEWVEEACGDTNCAYCVGRPETAI